MAYAVSCPFCGLEASFVMPGEVREHIADCERIEQGIKHLLARTLKALQEKETAPAS